MPLINLEALEYDTALGTRGIVGDEEIENP